MTHNKTALKDLTIALVICVILGIIMGGAAYALKIDTTTGIPRLISGVVYIAIGTCVGTVIRRISDGRSEAQPRTALLERKAQILDRTCAGSETTKAVERLMSEIRIYRTYGNHFTGNGRELFKEALEGFNNAALSTGVEPYEIPRDDAGVDKLMAELSKETAPASGSPWKDLLTHTAEDRERKG